MNGGSKLIGNASIYFGANVLNAAIPFMLLPVLTRVLTPADYGIIAMFGVVLSIFGVFTGLSVHGAIGVRYFQLEKEKLAEYITTCIGILVVSTVALFLLLTFFRSWLTEITGVPADWLLVAVVVSGLQFLGSIRLSLWQAAGAAKRYGGFQITQSLLNAGSSLALILLVGMAWEGRVLGQTATVGIFGIIGFGWLWKDGLLRKPLAWRENCVDALKFGIPLIPHVIGGLLVAVGGQFLVTNIFGTAETGLYVLAFQFGSAFGLISDAFVRVYGPWLYSKLQNDADGSRLIVVGATYIVFLSFLFLSLLFSIVLYYSFSFVAGDGFLAARGLIFPFVIGNGFVGMYYAVAGFFFFTSKTQYVAAVTLLSGITSLFLMYFLGVRLGLMGFAFGYMLSQVLTFLLAWYISCHVYPMPWRKARNAVAAVIVVMRRK